jgi:hypothetical protein
MALPAAIKADAFVESNTLPAADFWSFFGGTYPVPATMGARVPALVLPPRTLLVDPWPLDALPAEACPPMDGGLILDPEEIERLDILAELLPALLELEE